MGISLTLSELKQFFETWHTNNFNKLHEADIINTINNYFDEKGLSTKINKITDLQSSIINVIKYVSKSINGVSGISESSTLKSALNELSNKNVDLSTINLVNLNTKINQNNNNITTQLNKKADAETVNNRLSQLESSSGAVPKQLQVQDISNNSDLNNYKTPGLYKSATSETTSTLKHKPTSLPDAPFTLAVIPHMASSVKHILIVGNITDDGNRIYMRNYLSSENSWGKTENNGWYELYGDHNTKPLQMKIEWSDENLPNTTYTLLQR